MSEGGRVMDGERGREREREGERESEVGTEVEGDRERWEGRVSE